MFRMLAFKSQGVSAYIRQYTLLAGWLASFASCCVFECCDIFTQGILGSKLAAVYPCSCEFRGLSLYSLVGNSLASFYFTGPRNLR